MGLICGSEAWCQFEGEKFFVIVEFVTVGPTTLLHGMRVAFSLPESEELNSEDYVRVGVGNLPVLAAFILRTEGTSRQMKLSPNSLEK